MKFRHLLMLVACLGCLGLSGCIRYTAPVKPPIGILFTQHEAPLTTNFKGNPNSGDVIKVTKTETKYFRDILLTQLDFAWDDAAIAQYAKARGINTISYADYEFMHILGVYAQFTIHIYGME